MPRVDTSDHAEERRPGSAHARGRRRRDLGRADGSHHAPNSARRAVLAILPACWAMRPSAQLIAGDPNAVTCGCSLQARFACAIAVQQKLGQANAAVAREVGRPIGRSSIGSVPQVIKGCDALIPAPRPELPASCKEIPCFAA